MGQSLAFIERWLHYRGRLHCFSAMLVLLEAREAGCLERWLPYAVTLIDRSHCIIISLNLRQDHNSPPILVLTIAPDTKCFLVHFHKFLDIIACAQSRIQCVCVWSDVHSPDKVSGHFLNVL